MIIIKQKSTNKTYLSYYDLFGNNEIALTKALSYLISKDSRSYYELLKLLNINPKKFNLNYKEVEINVEKSRARNRTDIEIFSNSSHIIIECKIKTNRLNKQLVKYNVCFEHENKFMCFITQERDTNKLLDENICYIFLSWFDIINHFEDKKFLKNNNIQDFVHFANRRFKMKYLNEILIQDLSDEIEIKRFLNHNLYRRDVTFGTPLYFAPYFTQKSKKKAGISYISKVLGVLTFKSEDINLIKEDLKNFTEDEELIKKWISGVSINQVNEIKQTFYFLDKPYTFNKSIMKDKGKFKGVGKDWISSRITKNRTVSFIDFIKHIPELMD